MAQQADKGGGGEDQHRRQEIVNVPGLGGTVASARGGGASAGWGLGRREGEGDQEDQRTKNKESYGGHPPGAAPHLGAEA